jgi:hypothetical protein
MTRNLVTWSLILQVTSDHNYKKESRLKQPPYTNDIGRQIIQYSQLITYYSQGIKSRQIIQKSIQKQKLIFHYA